MNEPPILPVPPYGFDTDEALSALLDGELGAFAAEHGLTEEAVRAQLEARPGSAARLSVLQEIRGAVHAPPPPLDDLTRRRLVQGALDAGASHTATPRSRSWVAVTAVAAAGLLVVAGIGVAISSSSDNGAKSSTRSAASSATAPLRGDVGNLGDVTSPAALRALLDRRAAATGGAKEKSADGSTGSQPFDRGTAAGVAPDTAPPGAANAVSPDACARQVAGARDVTFVGTGTYRGAPVTIVGITEGGRTIVFVVSSTDCTDVLTSISR